MEYQKLPNGRVFTRTLRVVNGNPVPNSRMKFLKICDDAAIPLYNTFGKHRWLFMPKEQVYEV